jgi:hypothetical protein
LVGFIGKTGFSFKFISIPTSMVEHWTCFWLFGSYEKQIFGYIEWVFNGTWCNWMGGDRGINSIQRGLNREKSPPEALVLYWIYLFLLAHLKEFNIKEFLGNGITM